MGHLRRDCPEMDCSYGQVWAGHTRARPAMNPKLTIPATVGGRTTRALIDSGCGQTLVRKDLVPPADTRLGCIHLQCIHGDVRPYPSARVPLTIAGITRHLVVGVAPHLAYPVILGRDWPAFEEVLRSTPALEADRLGSSSETPEQGPATEIDDTDAAGPPPEPAPQPRFDTDFCRDQREDPTLSRFYEQLAAIDGNIVDPQRATLWPHFELRRDRLYRLDRDPRTQEPQTQLLVPLCHRRAVMKLAHDVPAAGHLGREKTLARILARFFWPGISQEVKEYCASCPECQRVAPPGIPKAPLVPMPVMETPFERVAMDLVGPLPKSAAGFQYILVLVDYASRFPEAIPLRSITARTIAGELLKIFARVGLPREILTDQGTNFTSQLLRQVCALLDIKQLRTSVYHPQTDGLVERFNRTLKSMLRKFPAEDLRHWDQFLPPLLLAIREVPQTSTKFSPFELLYGRRPRGLLDLMRETWEQSASPAQGLLKYVIQLQEYLAQAGALARENLKTAQERQKRTYDQGAQVREFQPGDRVLLLLPSSESKLLARWQGPYDVVRKVGPVTYEVRQPDKRKGTQRYHVNLLKRWQDREGLLINPCPPEPELGPHVPSTDDPPAPQLGQSLTEEQCKQTNCLLQTFKRTFTAIPGYTSLVKHSIRTEPGKVVRETTRPLPYRMREAVEEEVRAMLALGVIEPSQSEWRSPVVLVPKPDGTRRFCIDFRRVNAISHFDAYPMPRVDELLGRLGEAQYITTLDLSKGYWQIPLEETSKEKTAFATPTGLYQFTRMPFGLHGAPATFQRLMDQLLQPHQDYAAAYLDDVVIYSRGWEDHLPRVAAVLRSLRQAGLTANPKKCRIAWQETNYLGYTVGGGRVKPLVGKVQALLDCPTPSTKRHVRQFLGLVGYYRRFIPQFATIAASLTGLLTKDSPRQVRWSPECEAAFQTLQKCLCQEPVLYSPDFKRPFILQTDASGVGLGAVLSQEVEGKDHPVVYLSRKLFPRERNYAVVEKEALAVKWACDALRFYLLGAPFTLVTDHAPLRWLMRMKDNNARIMRWYLALQPYAFTVQHRAGKDHTNADFLSRMGEMEGPGPDMREPVLRGGVCSDSVWLPSCPEEGAHVQAPEWAGPPPPVPAPRKSRGGEKQYLDKDDLKDNFTLQHKSTAEI
ncbi:uncharacterized protein LOC135974099 [Chrysemys picta bellii]|uniref:uncharacterized protein LOC135974099 n=1 Tax=Chrysemys picta bellii TaxID=8478 RepID=UPI0032B22B1D